jgi:hypothetical protein
LLFLPGIAERLDAGIELKAYEEDKGIEENP